MTVLKGWKATVQLGGVTVGYVTDWTVTIDESLTAYFEVETRWPTYLVEGPINITGSFGKAWIDTNYLALAIGWWQGNPDYFNGGILNSFNLVANIPNHTLVLYNCKVSKITADIPQDDIVTETVYFTAESFQVT
jgi:hypothetical protein